MLCKDSPDPLYALQMQTLPTHRRPSGPQFCKGEQSVAFAPKTDAPFSDKQVRFVLAVCGVRDDPRLLARLAFGVTSPRLTQLGLSKHDAFGCCDSADFGKLLERFEAECAACGYKNKAVLAPPKSHPGAPGGAGASTPTAAKRPAGKASAGRAAPAPKKAKK